MLKSKRRVIQVIQNNSCFVLAEVLAEVTYVLSGKYSKFNRPEIAEALKSFIDTKNIIVHSQSALKKAFEIYGATNLDFVDCVLAGYGIADKEDVFTFDNQLKNFINQENSQDME